MGFNNAGIFSEDPEANPGFFDAHKVFVPYLSGDAHFGTRTEAYTFPSDPAHPEQPRGAYFFSGHLILENIIHVLRNNVTFTANGGGIGAASDVLLTGCSAGGAGVRGNADWLLDTLPATVNVRAAPTAGISLASTAWLNFQDGVSGGFPVPTPEHVPSPLESWRPYGIVTCVESSLADGLTEEEAVDSCASNEALVTSMRTPTLWLVPQFDTHPIQNQYINESDFNVGSDSQTMIGQMYLEQWGRESRRFLFDHTQNVFSPSCLDHCGLNLMGGSDMPRIDGATSLSTVTDWFFGHNLLPHKLIEGMTEDGNDQQPNDGLPFNPTCRNLLGESLIGDDAVDDIADDCSDACGTIFARCVAQLEGTGASATFAFDRCRRGIDQQHRIFAASCEAGCAATDAMLATIG
jgi:hypothetical protein